MRPIYVDEIMSSPVYTIDAEEPASEAVAEMDRRGVKKILVKKGGEPMGVLERWTIGKSDLNRKVRDLSMSTFRAVPRRTDVSTIQTDLRSLPAVYVADPEKANNLVGVVTAYDLIKAY